ncbi:N,N'-diacetylbacillosaminyl-diphospho-undecaprenol alpha-1,3-N-acetylgalactosaminyltransferase [Crateriforma conspicua]|uniref:N, N'-diacetylbacillosaminyl-diphospho-undecaprenol alpha-1,3-N-acetylgalactosaminyltransferase n=1 Tax=Crateriforma conspicua TaxID=2527996 RepID=A0A5C5Y427_9PLAN|nr:N,N'-diacetylbacillosaminyl-diphospho-undecaprenol alpha-1,3-N-acetylgalactosaminyltransferase [Crateriforma conspicua]
MKSETLNGQTIRPRLVHILTSGISAWGLLRGQLSYLKESGFDVTVIASPGTKLQQVADREGIGIAGVQMKRAPALIHDLRSLKELTHTLKRLDPHIVHFSTPKAGLLGSLAAYRLQTPIRIYTLRGLRADGFVGLKARTFSALEHIPCRISHRTVCVSESLKLRAEQLRICARNKLHVLSPQSSNGIDCSRFRNTSESQFAGSQLRFDLGIPSHSPVIAFIGRLHIEKGIVELIDAYDTLKHIFPNLILLLVGPKETYQGLPRHIENRIECDQQIISTGMLEDTVSAYAASDIVALPTYREGFPNVALEAAAMERPIVACKVTGCVDAVHDGVTGTLVPPRDSVSLCRALQRYLESPSMRRAHGESARRRVESQFSNVEVWRSIRIMYEELLSERGLPLPITEQMPIKRHRNRLSDPQPASGDELLQL